MSDGRGRIDDPGVMEGILERIRNRPPEYWLERLARYENEKPGDIVLPGVPPRRHEIVAATSTTAHKKPPRKNRKAA
jgi:hypothetical protein